jgi:hypothetical protein
MLFFLPLHPVLSYGGTEMKKLIENVLGFAGLLFMVWMIILIIQGWVFWGVVGLVSFIVLVCVIASAMERRRQRKIWDAKYIYRSTGHCDHKFYRISQPDIPPFEPIRWCKVCDKCLSQAEIEHSERVL